MRDDVEQAARQIDEILLVDHFFAGCKPESEIPAKGERSWTEHHLAFLDEVLREAMLAPARKVTPNVKVIIKYPNGYENFQGLGFNLETGEVLAVEMMPRGDTIPGSPTLAALKTVP